MADFLDSKNQLMKYLIIILSFCSIVTHAQYIVQPYGDMQGTPLKEIKYENVDGTPYLLDYWIKGKVTLKSGKQYADMSLKYDVMDDKLIFQGENGNSMYFTEPVTAFELSNISSGRSSKFVNGLPAADHYNNLSYYEVIFSGQISLLKKTSKTITENKEYGSAVVNKSFKTTNSYFSLSDGKFSKITLNKKTITTLFPSKEQQLSDYLKKEKIDLKNDGDLERLLEYLNKI